MGSPPETQSSGFFSVFDTGKGSTFGLSVVMGRPVAGLFAERTPIRLTCSKAGPKLRAPANMPLTERYVAAGRRVASTRRWERSVPSYGDVSTSVCAKRGTSAPRSATNFRLGGMSNSLRRRLRSAHLGSSRRTNYGPAELSRRPATRSAATVPLIRLK